MSATKLYGWEEIVQHRTEASCWVIIQNNVVDVTDFLSKHPGGVDPILQMGGRDTTNMFQAIDAHSRSDRATNEWKKRVIGQVDPNSKKPELPRPKLTRDQKPIRYGIDPKIFWFAVIAVIIIIVWALTQ